MGELLSPVGGKVCRLAGPVRYSTWLHRPVERLAAIISIILQFEVTDQLRQPPRLPGKSNV
jgi:hypothetical protein